MIVKPDPIALAAAAGSAAKGRGLPPVHLWNPPFCGDIDMEIRRDGTWFHEGSPIGRLPLVRLFSTILKREGDEYFLVTPVEKVRLRVHDTPFVAVDADVSGVGAKASITLTTNVGDTVTADAEHPIMVKREIGTGEPNPRVMVRDGLWARIDRKTFYRLVDQGAHAGVDGRSWFGLWSQATFFPVIPSSELA